MDNLEQARELFLAGIEELQGENYGKAEDLFRKSLTFAPDRPSSLDNLSVCLMHLKRLPEAEETCRRSLKINPESSTPWFNLGLIQRLMSRSNDALASLQKSIELDPKFPDAWNHSGLILAAQKRHPEAISCFESVLDLIPDHIEAMCAMAVSHAELKFYFSAFAVLVLAGRPLTSTATAAPVSGCPPGPRGRHRQDRGAGDREDHHRQQARTDQAGQILELHGVHSFAPLN